MRNFVNFVFEIFFREHRPNIPHFRENHLNLSVFAKYLNFCKATNFSFYSAQLLLPCLFFAKIGVRRKTTKTNGEKRVGGGGGGGKWGLYLWIITVVDMVEEPSD
jgi:hypothetical protein